MPRLKVNNCVFYREHNISKEKINYGDAWRQGSWTQEQLVKDIEQELLDNPSAPYIPPYQTHADLYDRMKNKKHWSDLYKKIRHSLMRFYTKEFNLIKSWANVSKENNQYGLHTHPYDLTVVYYVKCDNPEYGTYIKDEDFIIPATNDSLLVFNPVIEHKLSNMPFELAVHPHNHRYSIVFDFNIDKSKNPDNISK